MKYQLIKKYTNEELKKYTALEIILMNRGIEYNEINHYINTTDEDINSPLLFGKENLESAAMALIDTISQLQKAAVVVDADCDGFTSSALLINYLYDLFPTWVTEHLDWYFHEGKQHGLNDLYSEIAERNYSLVILPDSSSNDYDAHSRLQNNGVKVLVLDHHEAEKISPYAIVINNQLSDYPNKQLSGVGVTWQFCRYIDSLLKTNYAEKYIDLVALGLDGDMQSLREFETKHLINKGFLPDNIHNPFIYYMWQKNVFKLGEHISAWGAAFYIVPFVNAIVRSGTQLEKALVFDSMLTFKAFKKVASTKRGHKLGDMEMIVEQAVRTCTNVKKRQTVAQDRGVEFLEHKIQEENLLNHKVLLFLIEPGQIDAGIVGLVANKFMSKYQRPCCILTRVEEPIEVKTYTLDDSKANNVTVLTNPQVSYQGSARGCDKVGVTQFKDICASTGLTLYEAGHQAAFGLALREQDIPAFLEKTDEILKDMPDEALYYVDYIYNGIDVNPQHLLDISDMDGFWGKDMDSPLLAVQKLKVSADMVTIYRKTSNTIKITLPNSVNLMLFNATEEDCCKLQENNSGYVTINCIGTANKNEWNGFVTAQLFIEDYEIVDSCKFLF